MIGRLCFYMSLVFLISCEQTDPGPVFAENEAVHNSREGLFIMNEGNFTRGNGSISFYSCDSTKIYNNIFYSANNRGPGDVPYSMLLDGDTAYIVVNNSGKIEMTDCNTLAAIKTLSGLISPRYICKVSRQKGYVSSLYSSLITIIDLETLEIRGEIDIGHNSEMMVSIGSRVYAASWSGGRSITVINGANDQIISTVDVVLEPESMVADKNGFLWVLCSGGYMKEETPALIAIDTSNTGIAVNIPFPRTSYPTSLSINRGGDTLYYIDNGIYRMAIGSSELPGIPFIQAEGRLFYRLQAGTLNSDIFVTDARDYQRRGYLLRYSSHGMMKDITEAGIIPGAMTYRLKDER